MVVIAPSILAADFLHLERDVQMVNQSKADWFHLDVMDGLFVPNISYGFPIIDAINTIANKPLDIHLMIEKPERYIERFVMSGASCISIHYESTMHLHRTVQQIKEHNVKAGVAINPHTSVVLLKDILEEIDFVNIMSVNPGFGGQKFIENTYAKIKELRQLEKEVGTSIQIEIDGGVTLDNAPKLFNAGADILVAGSSVFNSENPSETIAIMKQYS